MFKMLTSSSFFALLFCILPIVLAAPTTTFSAAASSTSTLPCLSPSILPPDVAPYFYLKTNTLFNASSTKNNLYLSDYHVGAGSSVAVLVPETGTEFSPDLAYLNDTYLQLAIEFFPTGGSIYWYLLFQASADSSAVPQLVEVFGGGDSGVGQGYYFNDTDSSGRKGLKYDGVTGDGLFVGWLACDWFGTAGEVQLFPQFSFYWEGGDVAGLGADGVLPANCEAVELVQVFVDC